MTRRSRRGEGGLVPLSGVIRSVMPPAPTPVNSRIREFAKQLENTTRPEVLYQHAVLCQVPMPYKATSERRYHHKQGENHLWITAGEAVNAENEAVDFPLPYGPIARLISYHLVSEVKRQDYAGTLQPLDNGLIGMEIAPSMTSFAGAIGVRITGPGLEQFKRIFAAYCAAHWSFGRPPKHGSGLVQAKANIIEAFNVWFPKDEQQRVLWDSVLYLNPRFVDSVKERAVPLARPAIAALQTSALALDVYCWLAHRLQYPDVGQKGGVFIPWPALKEQFGPSVKRITDFRADFRRVLKMVLRVYPGARVDEEFRSKSKRSAGLRLRPSPPPIKGSLVALPKRGEG